MSGPRTGTRIPVALAEQPLSFLCHHIGGLLSFHFGVFCSFLSLLFLSGRLGLFIWAITSMLVSVAGIKTKQTSKTVCWFSIWLMYRKQTSSFWCHWTSDVGRDFAVSNRHGCILAFSLLSSSPPHLTPHLFFFFFGRMYQMLQFLLWNNKSLVLL